MKSFWELSRLVEEMGTPPPPPGGSPMGDPMGGLPGGPPMGGMGGGMGGPPMGGMGGGMGGLGGPPMGGGAGAATPVTQLKTSSVWSVWQKLLNGEPLGKDKDKSSGQDKSNVLEQPPQPEQPVNQPSLEQIPQPEQPSLPS
jgi:hypothetical protein